MIRQVLDLGLTISMLLLSQSVASIGQSRVVEIPQHILDFKLEDMDFSLVLPPVTSLPQCSTDGSLYLDLLDMKDLSKHTVIAAKGKKIQTYLPSGISDLHDVHISSFFPTESVVGFLVWGTRESAGTPDSGKSPAGFTWSGYHNYVAEFDHSGSYRKAVELPMAFRLTRLAILPSGELLVSGYDQPASQAKLLLLDSSGQILRALDMPAARSDKTRSAPFGSVQAAQSEMSLMGHLAFSSYNQDVLVWRSGSNDPILDVGPGGKVREVSLRPPPSSVLVHIIPSNDRWVALFRSESVADNSPLNQTDYSYYEISPQDGSISSQLVETGNIPVSIACEIGGTYISYKKDKDNKLVLVTAK